MAFTKLTNNLDTIEQLADTPNRTSGYTAQQMKEAFDQNAQIIKQFINDTLIAELEGNGAVSGKSGAKNVGVASRAEFSTSTNIEDVLLYFRGLIDTAQTGELVDNSIRTNMLNHTVGSEAVDTGSVRDNAITNAKLAGNISSDKIASVLASVLVGTITNSQLAGSITYDKLAGAIRASQLYGEIPADKLADSFNVSTFADKLSGAIPVSKGGTNGTTPATARANLEAVKLTVKTDATFTWTNDSGIADFPYKGTYTNANITSNTSADVIFGDADLENYSFSKRCNTDNGHLYVYCDSNPTLAETPIVRLFD